MEEAVQIWKLWAKDWKGQCVSTPEASLEQTGLEGELNYPKPQLWSGTARIWAQVDRTLKFSPFNLPRNFSQKSSKYM